MIDLFQESAEAVGSVIKRFVSVADAVSYIKELAGDAPVGASYLPPEIREAFAGMVFAAPEELADTRLCVSFAQAGIARTGSLLLELADPRERGATALPLLHVVFVKGATIVPDLYALRERLNQGLNSAKTAYLSITTGPSRTADIERVLTIGVHGPKELHVLVLEGA
jgi:L-lactate dehydrogenase complex protein LldG